jgi:hypothetical protein
MLVFGQEIASNLIATVISMVLDGFEGFERTDKK